MRWAIVPLLLLSGCGSLGQVFVDAYVGPNIPLNQDVTTGPTTTAGNFDGIIAASTRVHDIADDTTRIIPGHGDVATKADLKRYIDVLTTIRG